MLNIVIFLQLHNGAGRTVPQRRDVKTTNSRNSDEQQQELGNKKTFIETPDQLEWCDCKDMKCWEHTQQKLHISKVDWDICVFFKNFVVMRFKY